MKANYKEIKILASHCWLCGKSFDKIKHTQTMHHAIPQRLKPDRNVLIPVCNPCHKDINIIDGVNMPKLESIDNYIKGTKQIIKKYEKHLKALKYEK